MFFFALISIVVLAIGLLCHSYTFIPSTFLYLIQVACQSTCFCAEHHLHTQPFYVWPFPGVQWKQSPFFIFYLCHWQPLQHVDRVLLHGSFTSWWLHPQSIRPKDASLSSDLNTQSSNLFLLPPLPCYVGLCLFRCLHTPKSGPLSWLLLCWAARTCTLSPPMSCLCYTCLRRQNLFSCVHGPILTAATLYCMHLHFISPISCLCFEGLRNSNSSGRGGQRNTPTAVK